MNNEISKQWPKQQNPESRMCVQYIPSTYSYVGAYGYGFDLYQRNIHPMEHAMLVGNLKAEKLLNQQLRHELFAVKNKMSGFTNSLMQAKETLKSELITVMQKEADLQAENRKLQAEKATLEESLNDMKDKQIQESLKLTLQLEKLQDELEERVANVNALSAINDMLLDGSEKRDEIIAAYKKKLKKYTTLSSLSDSDSLPESMKPVQTASSSSLSCTTLQPRRIGRKALHALTALGAENTLGPWLCIICGTNETPINIQSYSEFRRHLVDVHKEVIDPALCEQCGWRSSSDRELHFHMYKEHQIDSLFYRFSKHAMLTNCEQD